MSFHRQIRTRVDCDGCGDQWLAGLDAAPVFASRAQARRQLTALGWTLTNEGMWCSECTARAHCAKAGHDWDTDADACSDTWVTGEPLPISRYCRICGEHLPPALAEGIGHPEHVPGLLTADEQAALIAMEIALGAEAGGPT